MANGIVSVDLGGGVEGGEERERERQTDINLFYLST